MKNEIADLTIFKKLLNLMSNLMASLNYAIITFLFTYSIGGFILCYN